jgi:hypothetical protein
MRARIFWNIRDWARAVAQMPVQGPLPCRTMLVPRERVAHVLRRELIRSKRPEALAGTCFLPTAFAAGEVLRVSGTAFEADRLAETSQCSRYRGYTRSGRSCLTCASVIRTLAWEPSAAQPTGAHLPARPGQPRCVARQTIWLAGWYDSTRD